MVSLLPVVITNVACSELYVLCWGLIYSFEHWRCTTLATLSRFQFFCCLCISCHQTVVWKCTLNVWVICLLGFFEAFLISARHSFFQFGAQNCCYTYVYVNLFNRVQKQKSNRVKANLILTVMFILTFVAWKFPFHFEGIIDSIVAFKKHCCVKMSSRGR